MENNNNKQNIEIAKLNKDICYIRRKVDNEIPHQIMTVDKKIDKVEEKVDKIITGLLFGFIIMIASTLLMQVLLRFID